MSWKKLRRSSYEDPCSDRWLGFACEVCDYAWRHASHPSRYRITRGYPQRPDGAGRQSLLCQLPAGLCLGSWWLRQHTHKNPIWLSPWLYKQRNLVERFFNKLKYYRRIATRYDKIGSAFASIVKLICNRIRLGHYGSTA